MQSWSYLHVHVCDSDQNFSWVYFHFMQTIQMDQDHQQKKKIYSKTWRKHENAFFLLIGDFQMSNIWFLFFFSSKVYM